MSIHEQMKRWRMEHDEMERVCLADFIQFKIACRRWKRENR